MAGYQVTRQIPDQFQLNGTGPPVVGIVVEFLTGDGNRGTVFVPDDQYGADSVRQAVAAKAALVDQIGALADDGSSQAQ